MARGNPGVPVKRKNIMTNTNNSVYCGTCQKIVPYHYATMNHGRELLKSVLTCGLWLPIWLFSLVNKTKICDGCGNAIIE
jgi:hypothetical protein